MANVALDLPRDGISYFLVRGWVCSTKNEVFSIQKLKAVKRKNKEKDCDIECVRAQ